MKQILIVSILVLLFYSCEQKKIFQKQNEFEIIVDTLNMSIGGYLRKAVLYNDNFYGIFETERKNTTERFKKMIVFDSYGNFIEDVFLPKEIQRMLYYKLVVDNDSLYIHESESKENIFVLDANITDFNRSNRQELKFFQDEYFDIYTTCRGEWGGTIYFRDKKDNNVYEAASTCPIVLNKIGNNYFVTNLLEHMYDNTTVIKISNPKELTKSKFDFDSPIGSGHDEGIEIILDSLNFYIPTSFVANNELYHLYSDENSTYIGKIENNKIKQVYKFDFHFYAHFNQHLTNGKQLLTYNFKNSSKSGLLIIEGSKFKFLIQK